MQHPDWVGQFPGAVTVCDREGTILYMNEKSCRTFSADGGEKLVGENVLDCHPEPAKTRLAAMLAEGRSNAYTIEKKGVRKIIYQSPWYQDGQYAGFVELSLEIPADMPHYVRS